VDGTSCDLYGSRVQLVQSAYHKRNKHLSFQFGRLFLWVWFFRYSRKYRPVQAYYETFDDTQILLRSHSCHALVSSYKLASLYCSAIRMTRGLAHLVTSCGSKGSPSFNMRSIWGPPRIGRSNCGHFGELYKIPSPTKPNQGRPSIICGLTSLNLTERISNSKHRITF
jgi:hypothetical protein